MTSTTIKRSEFATYLDKDPGYEDWVLIGEGVTESAMEMNPNVTNEQYIHEDAGNAEVESYAPTQPVQMVGKNGDDVSCKFSCTRMIQMTAIRLPSTM